LARNWFGAKTLLIPYKILARQYFSLLLIANQVSTLLPYQNIGILTFWLALKLAWQRFVFNQASS